MRAKPERIDLVALLKDADEQQLVARLDEVEAEAVSLRMLLRALRARQRSRRKSSKTEASNA